MKKKLCVLGSTGSIGKSTLQVVENFPSHFSVYALAAKENIDILEKQIRLFQPKIVAVFDKNQAQILRKNIADLPVIVEEGIEGICAIAAHEDVDFVMAAISGSIGLLPVLRAIEAKKTIGLANKEVLVAAGEMVMEKAEKNAVSLLPVDSEHNALFQILQKEKNKNIQRLILTASGGPFYFLSPEKWKDIALQQALAHPTYQMGKKISVDSSTLMNKGLEVIEAHYLFAISVDKIDVVIHPQSIVHSMVEFCDHSLFAQMSYPDMTLPIQHVLFYPLRQSNNRKNFDFTKYNQLTFFPYQKQHFLCLDLAIEAAKNKKSMPCFLNAANEVLVDRFLQQKISWIEIGKKLEKIMQKHNPFSVKTFEDVMEVEKQAHVAAQTI